MTQPEDRSYYEISLTSGQVLLAFGVLLACVLGAFVSGMWVAREALEDTESAASERSVDEGEPTDTLDFFDANARASSASAQGAAAPADEAPEPSESAPASQEAQSRQIQQVKPVPPARAAQTTPTDPSSERAAAATEIPNESAEAPADAEAEPDSAPVGAEMAGVDSDRREPVSDTRTEAGGSPPEAAGQAGFVIQVFSSSDEAQAEALVRRLRGSGYSVFRSSESVSGRTVHRVRVGPYPDRPAAEREAEMLKRDFKLDTWVTASG